MSKTNTLSKVEPIPLGRVEHMRPAQCDTEKDFALLITREYHEATGGMVSVLRFGARMAELRAWLMSTCGHKELPRGTNSDGGVSKWLEEHAPEVKRPTAYRLEAVFHSVEKEYVTLVGAKTAKAIDITSMVTTPTEQLPEAIRAKQMELFDYVRGTSQRSWLDKVSPKAHTPGGNTYERGGEKGARKTLTHAEAMELLRTVTLKAMEHLRFVHDKHAYAGVKDEAELDGLLNHLEATTKAVRAWKSMTQGQRAAALGEFVKNQIAEADEEA